MFNNPTVCMVIDELDAGIFEYLLGEILQIISENGKGQLIFTSHNLRPLEMLDTSSIIFTTTNPKNRYMRFTNVKSNNNLRNLYYRSINLGGQKEEIYKETNSFDISRAFRLAGRVIDEN
jgi:AAA15 family ATPase/GTPase